MNCYSTIDCRHIIIPEINKTLHISTIKLPDNIKKLLSNNDNDIDNNKIENNLMGECIKMFNIPSYRVLSYRKWEKITKVVLDIISSEKFKTQILNTYVGGESSKKDIFDKWINENEYILKTLLNTIETRNHFIEIFIRNVILSNYPSDFHLKMTPPIELLNSSFAIWNSIYSDLEKKKIRDFDFHLWRRYSLIHTCQVLPSVKEVFLNIIKCNYEIAFAESPGLNKRFLNSIINATKKVKGVAEGVLGGCIVCFVTGPFTIPIVVTAVASGIVLISCNGKYIEEVTKETKRNKNKDSYDKELKK